MRDVPIDRHRAGLWLVAAALFAVLAFVLWRYVGTMVLGVFVYYITRPVYDRVRRRVPSPSLAAAASLLLVALPVLVLLAWTLLVAVREGMAFLRSGLLEQYQDMLGPYVDVTAIVEELEVTARRLLADPSALRDLQLGETFGGVVDALLASVGLVATGVLHLFVALVVAFYLLRDDYRLADWARGVFVADKGVLDAYFRVVDRDLKNVYFGNILNALATAVLGVVTYNLVDVVAPAGVGIPRPTLLGLLTGVASLVPVVGMKLVWIPAAAVVLADSLATDPRTVWFPALFVLMSVVVVDYIPDQLLRPYVSGRTLHVGAVMLAYVLGTLLFGWYGIFLGPLILVVVFEFARVVVPWLADPDEWQPPPALLEGERERRPSIGERVRAASVGVASALGDVVSRYREPPACDGPDGEDESPAGDDVSPDGGGDAVGGRGDGEDGAVRGGGGSGEGGGGAPSDGGAVGSMGGRDDGDATGGEDGRGR